MDKKLISIFLVTIIVTFILTDCGATLIKSNDTSLEKSEEEISLDNKALASEGKLIMRNNNMKNHSKKDEYLNDNNKKNTSNTINNSSFKANNKSRVIPDNIKPVENLKNNAQQVNKKFNEKQPIINENQIDDTKLAQNNPTTQKDDNPDQNDSLIKNDHKPLEIIKQKNEEKISVLCQDAWFDETKPCDYIPDNLKPTDELGRSVPHFFTSQEAWNWGETQIEDENSKYGCRGFSRMDGYQNDGTQFFFAYLKVCDIN